jgi:hypothetical protein
MFIGHPVAILIWNDFERFRQAKLKLQFNDQAIRYGAQAPLYQRDPMAASASCAWAATRRSTTTNSPA